MSRFNINNIFDFLARKSNRVKKLKDADIIPIGRTSSSSIIGFAPFGIRYEDLKKRIR